jgi:hypothetical protein
VHRGARLTLVALADRHVDLRTRRVVRSGRSEERLSERESALLAYLAARPGQPVSRDELLKLRGPANAYAAMLDRLVALPAPTDDLRGRRCPRRVASSRSGAVVTAA